MGNFSLTLPEALLPVSCVVKGEPVIVARDIIPAAVNAHVRALGLRAAILLDGGHMAAVNCPAGRKNVNTKQYYIVQGV